MKHAVKSPPGKGAPSVTLAFSAGGRPLDRLLLEYLLRLKEGQA